MLRLILTGFYKLVLLAEAVSIFSPSAFGWWTCKDFSGHYKCYYFLIFFIQFLGSMLPQYLALSVSQLVTFVKKNLCVCSLGYIVGVSVCLVTLWVCPPLVCVRSFGHIVGAAHPVFPYIW